MYRRKSEKIHLPNEFRSIEPEGSWVFIKGNPFAPRGHRLPTFCKEHDIKHLDVRWAFKERVNHYIFQDFEPPDKKEEYNISDNEVFRVLDNFNTTHLQTTLVEIAVEKTSVLFWNGEVSKASQQLLQELVESNMTEVNPVYTAAYKNPITDEAIRHIVDAAQLDGLTKAQATEMAINAGIIGEEHRYVPQHFYRLTNIAKEMFVEE